jgi:hypothetical protein
VRSAIVSPAVKHGKRHLAVAHDARLRSLAVRRCDALREKAGISERAQFVRTKGETVCSYRMEPLNTVAAIRGTVKQPRKRQISQSRAQ